MDEREAEAAGRVIRSGWITQGPEVAAFESEFAKAVGAQHACAVASGTAALHLALLAVGVGPGDEVVTVSHSFVATAGAIRYTGAMPVFVDIDAGTFNIDPERVEDAITPRTRAILCVHQLGMPCDLRATLAIAGRRGIAVVEDAACAVGSEIRIETRWEAIGRPHGDIACFSFHPRKLLSTGEGGMITTSNPDWDRQCRLRRQHGMSVAPYARHLSRTVVHEAYTTVGYSYRMTDIQAAIGRVQLTRLPELIARRRLLAQRYAALLRDVPGVTPPVEPAWARSNWQSYAARLDEALDQEAVMQRLLHAGVATQRGVMCAHREAAYPRGTWSCGVAPGGCDCAPGTCRRLCESERARDHVILLPLYHELTEDDQSAVVEALRGACQR
jgi:dTDP-4-amino-4,6-dideoxygalactose transaminase